MILDSSAVIAILNQERYEEELLAKITDAFYLGIGTPTLVELSLVLENRFNADSHALLDFFLQDFDVEPIAFQEEHWEIALTAFRRYGKGRHRAALNFGDCLTYAIAKLARQPLLFVGNDFVHTDLLLA